MRWPPVPLSYATLTRHRDFYCATKIRAAKRQAERAGLARRTRATGPPAHHDRFVFRATELHVSNKAACTPYPPKID